MKTLIIAVTLLLLGGSGLLAQPGPGAGAWKKMNLSDEQKTALKNIRAEIQKQMIDLRASLSKKRVDLRAMMDSENPDRAAFERLNREIADLQVKQKLLLFDADRDILARLNLDQREQWKEIKSSRMQRFGQDLREDGKALRGPGAGRRGSRSMHPDMDTPPPPPVD